MKQHGIKIDTGNKNNRSDRKKGKSVDTKGVIKSYKSNDRQYNGQKKTDKRTNNDKQNTTEKTNVWAIQTRHERGCSGWVNSVCSAGDTHRVSLATEMLLIIHLSTIIT